MGNHSIKNKTKKNRKKTNLRTLLSSLISACFKARPNQRLGVRLMSLVCCTFFVFFFNTTPYNNTDHANHENCTHNKIKKQYAHDINAQVAHDVHNSSHYDANDNSHYDAPHNAHHDCITHRNLPIALPFSFHVNSAYASFFSDFSIADEKELGKQFEILVKSQLPIIEDPVIKLYIVSLMETLLAQAPAQPFNYQANVIYHNSLNAFASPGGFIFVFSGLINELENETQLAGIMAHEIAHLTQRHAAKNIDKSKYLSIGSILGMLAGALAGGDTASALIVTTMAANQAAQLSYSRSDENDADKFALQYVLKANFNPLGLAESFQILENSSFGMGSTIPTYLSTHPALNARIANIKSAINSLPKNTQYRPLNSLAFQRAQAMSMAYFADPRKAQIYFSDRLKDTTSKSLAHLGLAILASKSNNIQEASKQFETAIQLAPQDFLVFREAGRFHFEKGDHIKAHTYLDKAIKLNSEDYMAIFYKARLLDSEKKYNEAQANYKEVLRYAPEDVEVYNLYGRSLGRSGKEFEGYMALAYAQIYSNNNQKAKSWLTRARKLVVRDEDKNLINEAEALLAMRQKYLKKK